MAGEKVARGGPAKGMDLSRVRKVRETPEAFHLSDGRGEFRVAKSGLSRATMDKITQHFADGGEVAPEVPVLTGDPGTDALIASRAPPPPVAPGGAPALPVGPVIDVRTGRPVAFSEPPVTATEPTPEARAALNADLAARGVTAETVTTVPSHGPASSVAPVAAHTPASAVPVTLAAPAAPGAPAPTASGVSLPGVPAVQGEIAAGRSEQARGLSEQARVAQEEGAQQAQILADSEKRREAERVDYESRLKGLQAKGDALYQSVLDKKVDPRRLWGSLGTGSKITASIGMILGGIGSALTHGPNYAVEIIDREIQRDIEAQKTEIDKGQNLLSHNLRQTDDLRAAHQLTRADLLDATAAKIQMASASFAGDKAKASALAAVGNLRAEAAKERQQVAATAMQMAAQRALLPLQVEGAQLDAAYRRAQMGALTALTNAQAAPEGGPSSGGARIDPRAIALLPEETQERVVKLNDGSFAFTQDPKDADGVRKSQEAATVLRAKLQRYNALLEKHPHGVSSTLSPEDYATAEALHSSIITDINGLSGLNRFTETESEIYSKRVPDIREKQMRAGHQAKLHELGKEIDEKVWATNKTYLLLPPRPMPGR